MKLLLDANLSPRLAAALADVLPGSAHVLHKGLGADDLEIWEYAKHHGFTIISKDSDFYRMSVVWGAPPKVAWLRVGKKSTAEIERIIRAAIPDLMAFDQDDAATLLILDAC